MKYLTKMLYYILNTDPQTLGIIISVETLFFGLYLLLPLNTFEASGVYHIMRGFASEMAWGIFLTVLGGLHLFIVHHRRWIRRRMVIATLTMFVWISLVIGFWLSGSASAAPISYTVYCFIGIWNVAALSYQIR